METKEETRTKYRKLRNALPEEVWKQESDRICQNIMEWKVWKEAAYCFFYYPLGKEASLLPLARECLMQKKKIAFPRVCGEEMQFCRINSLLEFEEGYFHVMEPLKTIEPMDPDIRKQEQILVFTPGLVFDRNGGRSGYGKGFYDRFFQKYQKMKRIGIALSIQVAEQVPMEPHDIPMDYLVTPQMIYPVAGRKE